MCVYAYIYIYIYIYMYTHNTRRGLARRLGFLGPPCSGPPHCKLTYPYLALFIYIYIYIYIIILLNMAE